MRTRHEIANLIRQSTSADEMVSTLLDALNERDTEISNQNSEILSLKQDLLELGTKYQLLKAEKQVHLPYEGDKPRAWWRVGGLDE